MSNVEVVGKDKDGQDVTIFVRRPTSKDSKEAKMFSNMSVSKSIKAGTFLTRSQARDQLKAAGIWGDKQEADLLDISNQINDLSGLMQSGKNKDGVQLKKSEGRAIALQIIELRDKQIALVSRINELDEYTIEAQAENDEFDYLVSVCLLDEEGNRLFGSVDEYKEKAAEQPYYFTGAQELQNIVYGFKKIEDIAKDRIEYKFLQKYNFINDKLQFINSDGKLVDKNNKRVDEEGYYIDDNNERIVKPVETGEFLDD